MTLFLVLMLVGVSGGCSSHEPLESERSETRVDSSSTFLNSLVWPAISINERIRIRKNTMIRAAAKMRDAVPSPVVADYAKLDWYATAFDKKQSILYGISENSGHSLRFDDRTYSFDDVVHEIHECPDSGVLQGIAEEHGYECQVINPIHFSMFRIGEGKFSYWGFFFTPNREFLREKPGYGSQFALSVLLDEKNRVVKHSVSEISWLRLSPLFYGVHTSLSTHSSGGLAILFYPGVGAEFSRTQGTELANLRIHWSPISNALATDMSRAVTATMPHEAYWVADSARPLLRTLITGSFESIMLIQVVDSNPGFLVIPREIGYCTYADAYTKSSAKEKAEEIEIEADSTIPFHRVFLVISKYHDRDFISIRNVLVEVGDSLLVGFVRGYWSYSSLYFETVEHSSWKWVKVECSVSKRNDKTVYEVDKRYGEIQISPELKVSGREVVATGYEAQYDMFLLWLSVGNRKENARILCFSGVSASKRKKTTNHLE
ncbi:MAG: hypothetical protein U5N86_12035 [Planctomycetota bacterium]|nr:hypothetical protein [Planctomycetota bacterium]